MRVEGNPKHNGYYTPAYRVWANMKARCRNKNATGYANYGKRGITYDPRWEQFENFLADMGQPPSKKHQLDRKENDGKYCKENCRWATKSQQSLNRRLFHNNQSGLAGLHYEDRQKRWRSRIYVNGIRKILYTGPDLFEAACVLISWRNHGTKQTPHNRSDVSWF